MLKATENPVVGRWILFLEEAAYPAHYGIFIRRTGSEFYDMTTHGILEFHESDFWFDRLSQWDRFSNQRGLETEKLCRFTRSIQLDKGVIKPVLRANRKGIVWIKEGQSLAVRINRLLEYLFWVQLAPLLESHPRRRIEEGDPMKPAPDFGDI